MSEEAFIRLQGVARSWRMGDSEVHALHGIDLAIARGEFVAIVGPSGSGKSTLLHVLGLLDRPSRGSYRLDGQEAADLGDRARSRLRNRHIGYVFQQYHLLPKLPVLDNIGLGLAYAGVDPQQRLARSEALAQALGLGQRLGHRPQELSGGQMQRVAIARGLAGAPSLILADEPTGNLDRRTGAEIMAVLRGLHAQGHTLVLVTHDPEVAAVAPRVVRIVDGSIVDDRRQQPSDGQALVAGEAGAVAVPPLAVVPAAAVAGRGRLALADQLRMAVREGLLAHRLRTSLTMLGIIFGIAAVIAMAAITEGGKRSQLAQLRQIGMNAIQVSALDLAGPRLLGARRANPRGLTTDDLAELTSYVPGIAASAAWKGVRAEVRAGDTAVEDATTLGVVGDFQEVANFPIDHGRFLQPRDQALRERVCVLGASISDALGLHGNAIGATVVIGEEPFTVVGVMRRRPFTASEIADIAIPDRNREVYIPYATLRAYYPHEERDSELDGVGLRMDTDARLVERSQTVARIIDALHEHARDTTVAVPLERLRQAQHTREIFNIIIIVIAAIALVVGGIGIMNIMLASVTERRAEIGVRRAVGASRRDILAQFLCEAGLICALGAVLGLVVGVAAGWGIHLLLGFPVAFVWWTMVVSVAAALGIGIGFGIYPAHLAARLDPVEALRG